jgi:hypothetical protein
MFGKLTDMKMSTEEKADFTNPTPPVYPYGLCLSLGNDELEKLGVESDDEICVGDVVHLKALAKVTSHSLNETEDGARRRVELQIVFLALEDEEDEEVEKPTSKSTIKKFYK